MPTEIDIENDVNTKDFTNVKGVHRFRNHNVAAKLSKNLCHPTAMLHVANMPDDFKAIDLQKYLVEEGDLKIFFNPGVDIFQEIPKMPLANQNLP